MIYCILRTISTPEVTIHSTTNANSNSNSLINCNMSSGLSNPYSIFVLCNHGIYNQLSRPKRRNECSHALLSRLCSSYRPVRPNLLHHNNIPHHQPLTLDMVSPPHPYASSFSEQVFNFISAPNHHHADLVVSD